MTTDRSTPPRYKSLILQDWNAWQEQHAGWDDPRTLRLVLEVMIDTRDALLRIASNTSGLLGELERTQDDIHECKMEIVPLFARLRELLRRARRHESDDNSRHKPE
jgi:hypothetical protein